MNPNSQQPPPPWITHARTFVGRTELVGGKLSEWVRSLFRATRFPWAKITKTTPWCAAFVCTMLEAVGVRSPQTARARDFLRWGIPLAFPVAGAVVIFARGPDAGHVGFALGPVEAGKVHVIGGNQGNRVSMDWRASADLLGVRWPQGWPLPPDAIRA